MGLGLRLIIPLALATALIARRAHAEVQTTARQPESSSQTRLWTEPPPDCIASQPRDWVATGFATDPSLPSLPQSIASPDRPAFVPPDPSDPLSVAARPDLRTRCCTFGSDVVSDYRQYYSCTGLLQLAGGVGVNAVLANTSLDGRFRDWYQDSVRSRDTDHFAAFWKTFGEGGIFFPSFAALGLLGTLCDDHPCMALVGEFGTRVTRGYVVGAPPMLMLQYMIGAGRPENNNSNWQPCVYDNGVSGHAFTGAVPFITAASMVENPALKGGFYVLSTFPAWSRVNDDKHYLSQVVLGWWMAYLAVEAVNHTETQNKNFQILPVSCPDMTGLTFTWAN